MLTPPDYGCFEQLYFLVFLCFIQKLLKHSKSWIRFFPATAGTEVQVFAAAGTEALAVLRTEELGLHIQDEAGGQDLV